MRRVLLLVLLSVFGFLGWRYIISGSDFRVDSPLPFLTKEEAESDRPVWSDFDPLSFKDVTVQEAKGFPVAGGKVEPLWDAELSRLGLGSFVQISGPLKGRMGVCFWYRFRILDSLGREVFGFVRAGPRQVGQSWGFTQSGGWWRSLVGTSGGGSAAASVADYSEQGGFDTLTLVSDDDRHAKGMERLRDQIRKAIEERKRGRDECR